MYSFSIGNLPPKFDSFFSVNNSIHSYNTRHASFFRLPLCRRNIGRFSISFQAPKFFNTLSCEIKNTPTLMSFKRKLKGFQSITINFFLSSFISLVFDPTLVSHLTESSCSIYYFCFGET